MSDCVAGLHGTEGAPPTQERGLMVIDTLWASIPITVKAAATILFKDDMQGDHRTIIVDFAYKDVHWCRLLRGLVLKC